MLCGRINPLVRVVLVAAVAAAFAATFLISQNLGLDRHEPSSRMKFHAIPVAISQIFHGRTHDYTAYRSIAVLFHNRRPIDPEIRAAIDAQIPANDSTYYWAIDDRGLSDFVNAAFRLFGPTVPALFKFWFVLLGLSTAIAVVRFHRDATALALIGCAVIGVGMTVTALTRGAFETFTSPSIHIAESRMFDVLAIVPLLHLLLSMVRPPAALRSLAIGAIIVQAALIAALVHARGSVSWVFVAIILIGFALSLLWWRKSKLAPSGGAVAVVLCAVVAAYAGLHLYQRIIFNPAYLGEIGPRIFWHNVLMGLSANPKFARELNLDVNDKLAVQAVLDDLRARNDLRIPEQWDARAILNSVVGDARFDWPTYELLARNFIVRTLLSDPWQALKLVAWDKPVGIVKTLSCRFLMIIDTCDNLHFERARAGPLRWIWVFLVALIAICLLVARMAGDKIARHETDGMIVAMLLAAALVGLTPTILTYPFPVQMGGAVVLFYTVVAFCIVLAVARLQGVLHRIAARIAGTRVGL
jgi:hypothetical protein